MKVHSLELVIRPSLLVPSRYLCDFGVGEDRIETKRLNVRSEVNVDLKDLLRH